MFWWWMNERCTHMQFSLSCPTTRSKFSNICTVVSPTLPLAMYYMWYQLTIVPKINIEKDYAPQKINKTHQDSLYTILITNTEPKINLMCHNHTFVGFKCVILVHGVLFLVMCLVSGIPTYHFSLVYPHVVDLLYWLLWRPSMWNFHFICTTLIPLGVELDWKDLPS